MSDEVQLIAVDGSQLGTDYREILRPGAEIRFANGALHRLPRFFFEVPSWEMAHQVRVAPHFKLAELMMVDCREAALQLRYFPHYVPCAIVLLARHLEALRGEVGAAVFVSANGGYRSPSHRLSRAESMHQWATAADIYRVGDTYLDDEKAIAKYARLAQEIGSDAFVRPYADGDDHLHIDIGFATLTPRELSEAE
jgi:hypothetical protein